MAGPSMEEIELLVDILNRHPLDSLRKISREEGMEYYKLKRLYDRYYGRYVTVNAMFNIRRVGLRSFVAFMNIPRESLKEVGFRITKNPFVGYTNPIFGFKNGLYSVLHIPDDQRDRIDELLSRYSDDYEFYGARAYPPSGDDSFGNWNIPYEYAILIDILKWDARTPVTEMARKLGKTRPTVRYMINRLREEGILLGFIATIEMNIHDRGVVGLTRELKKEVLEKFRDYEINAGILFNYGYLLEWYFSSKDDLGSKILEFSSYVEKMGIMYFDETFRELNNRNLKTRCERMVRKDGKGYRSIMEF